MTLAKARPDLVAQWHPLLNGDRTPESTASKASVNAWWVGPCGHEWKARVANRVVHKSGCPFCAGQRVLVGFNDLATTHPDLSKEWSRDHNDTTPRDVHAGVTRKAWWTGPCGHEWESSIKDRARSGAGCPFCAGKKVLPGFNDLAHLEPKIAALWHPSLNGDLTAQHVSRRSKKPVWWTCPEGHEWKASPFTVTSSPNSSQCPKCASITVTHPELAAEWHPTKNGPLTARDVRAGSNKKVWWLRPECGHEWEAKIDGRAGKMRVGCPLCTHRVSRAEHDLRDEIVAMLDGSGTVQQSARTSSGLEIDLLITHPRGTLAVEYNGVYWHSEKFRGKHRHREKLESVIADGHDFFVVWEDDWNNRRSVVLASIAHRVGRATGDRVGARSLTPARLRRIEAETFLDAHHLQGITPASTTHFGLRDKEHDPRAVLSVRRRSPGIYEVVRYAADGPVPGGFSRLLAHAERELADVSEWVTFSDHSVSQGDLYERTGFAATQQLAPDYSYVGNHNGWRREHKFNYRLARFRDDPTLVWREGATERELAADNGLLRVWDYGKTKWVKQV